MSKKVFIKSIPRPSAYGISEWANDASGKKLEKTKVGQCQTKISALYSSKIGGLANYISYTPYMNPETGTPFTNEKGHPIMLQEYLEKKWGKPEGFFSNRPYYKGDSLKSEDLTFFQKTTWALNDGTTVFDLSSMHDEMGYYVALGSSKVANSEREWREHKWPRAEFYISLENETDEIKHRKNATKAKAFAALEASDFTAPLKRKVVSLLELASSRASLTTEQVENLLYDYVDKSSFLPGSNIDKLTEVLSLLKTPHGREQFEARYLLKQAIDSRVIYEKQDTYTWTRSKGPIVIGDRLTEAIDFLLNPKKAAEVEELTAEINAKNNQ